LVVAQIVTVKFACGMQAQNKTRTTTWQKDEKNSKDGRFGFILLSLKGELYLCFFAKICNPFNSNYSSKTVDWLKSFGYLSKI
jgi:hypothetical protein